MIYLFISSYPTINEQVCFQFNQIRCKSFMKQKKQIKNMLITIPTKKIRIGKMSELTEKNVAIYEEHFCKAMRFRGRDS